MLDFWYKSRYAAIGAHVCIPEKRRCDERGRSEQMSRVSIVDIARVAGVSHSTVSRALHDSPLVNQETKERIQRLARQLGYLPDSNAQSLVTGRSRTLGVVVTTIADPFVAQVVQGIEAGAQDGGYSVILAVSGGEPTRELGAVEMLGAKRVDAVVVTSSRVGALYLGHLERLRVPVVLINSHSEQAGRYTFAVSVDNRDGGALATQHLLRLGHRRIAYVAAALGHSDDTERQAGYRGALARAGQAWDPDLVITGTGRPEGGELAFAALWANRHRPTAVFCYNDMTAIGVMRAARDAGVAVPGDLAVVGFDDIPMARYVCPSLTTVHQPMERMGMRASEMARALCERGIGDADVGEGDADSLLVQGHLVVRESSGETVTSVDGK